MNLRHVFIGLTAIALASGVVAAVAFRVLEMIHARA